MKWCECMCFDVVVEIFFFLGEVSVFVLFVLLNVVFVLGG